MKKLIAVPLLISAFFAGCSYSDNSFPDNESLPEIEVTELPLPSPVPTVVPIRDYEVMDSKGIGWGFVRKKGSEPELPSGQIADLEKNGGIYLDHSGEKNLYLTFDEGYENGYTAKILDTLAEKQVKAAFFVTGPYLESQKELIQRMINEGHIVGNHTVNHLNLPKQPTKTVQNELEELNKKSEELYGYSMHYMRPPEGEYSVKVLAIASDLGYKTVMWSMAYKDWDVNIQEGAAHAVNKVIPYLHPGAVMLLHAVSSDNTSALGEIIDTARGMGYEFKSLDEYKCEVAAAK